MSLEGFHPTVARWFAERLGEPTAAQREGWPLIRAGRPTLIAAPTGTGKTLAAFLHAIDTLLRQGDELADRTQVLYVSPLKALSNDVQKNLAAPLAELRAMDPSLPAIRVMVRTGDTQASQRAAMTKRPPHVLVTTPESLYILLTTAGGRRMLSSVRTVIVDEIHAVTGSKRGSHLALSLERLEALANPDGNRPVQRIGLSATQKPLEDVGRFLVGAGRECALVDAGHLREIDLAIEVPPSPLETVCSHETWGEIYARIGELVRAHRTTLVFVNTRKLAERVSARLAEILGEDLVASHHGSLSRDRRLDAEQRLKAGKLRALVATASLELGLDIGDVDLVVQLGATWSIATLLQRVGRAGHGVGRTPKGRVFPLTQDELIAAIALVDAVGRRELDRTPIPDGPLDILAQQVVAACAGGEWDEDELFDAVRRAWPYRGLTRADFDATVALHTAGVNGGGRAALLHRDAVGRRLMATKRARLVAVTCGGAIPDNADYRVVQEPEGTFVGTVHEDFAVESNSGDIFQLGTTSWRILRVEPGIVRVADAKGAIPNLPFWIAEAPARTRELAAAVAALRESAGNVSGSVPALSPAAAEQAREYLDAGRAALGTVPTQRRVVLERFFDETGGMQLVLHAPFGGRINRAWGLALRKRFCVGFGFELQAAATEDAILLSLSPQHAFDLAEVFDYLHPNTAREVLVQALLASPMFEARWRWNAQRSLLVERSRNGKRVPAPLLRMRADDQLMAAFPAALACPETLPSGPLEVPVDHPLVRQTIEDCLHEAMDVDGFLGVLQGLRDGTIERVAVDTTEPSPFARHILNAMPYAFLDDAPLEERRTQAVLSRRALDVRTADTLGALDPDAVRRVREEAWPQPESAEEVHEALLWMGWVTAEESKPWAAWIAELEAAGRVQRDGDRWFATEASRDPKTALRGRMEALGPVVSDDPLLPELEREGVVLRARLEGRDAWCDRRLLARIHRYTVERLRREIDPVTAAEFLRFLAAWQHATPERKLEGPRGVAEVVTKLAGFEIPAASWEASVLPARIHGYRREWLDQLTLSGQVAWGRLWGGGASAIRTTPIALVPREDLSAWTSLAPAADASVLSAGAQASLDAMATHGAMFPQEVAWRTRLLPSQVDEALAELAARGLVTCDSFGGLRALIVPPSRRRQPIAVVGRWSLFRRGETADVASAAFVAKALLRRTGVVFRRTIEREKQPVPWRDLARVYRQMELRGDVRGGRFVAGFSGEQFALPEAVVLLRKTRRDESSGEPLTVSAADPLNFRGILTPDERVSPATRGRVAVG
jgi:ATP-dependent Lhr-like helicase